MVDMERLDAHLNNGEREYILCAAIYVNDGKEYNFKPYNIDKGLVFCGWRHPCIFETMPFTERQYMEMGFRTIQGFLTNKNRFLDRNESLVLVRENGQLTKDLIGSILTSEDLW